MCDVRNLLDEEMAELCVDKRKEGKRAKEAIGEKKFDGGAIASFLSMD